MKKIILLLLLFVLFSFGAFSQKRDFVRMGVGIGLEEDSEANGWNLKMEYGRQFNALEVSGDFSVFNNLPFKSYDSRYYEKPKEGSDSYMIPGLYSWDDVSVDGWILLSANINANVNVLYFIDNLKMSKHQVKLGGGIGGYACYTQQKTANGPDVKQRSISLYSDFSWQWMLSAKYEYKLTDRINLGLNYDYITGFDTKSVLSVSVKRYF